MSSKTAAPSNIITSAPYSDLTNNLLTKSPTSPTARSKSTQSGNSVQRAMNNTSTWQPKLDRRQSYGQEEYKHEMQMRSGSTGGSVRKAGEEGFSEEGHGY
ncbi:hypothetical protein B0H65DRAFT_289948 [Neurospora tetraspora]|uniref:Uncharacterized protein n=1 Tax=Neurospora tetraspora TaxID=94610 RepID=A0AAE0MNE8_9PEZI|nr:hypothetical protein B0H65DRAFT_289948 [Neurospora tetraspora]